MKKLATGLILTVALLMGGKAEAQSKGKIQSSVPIAKEFKTYTLHDKVCFVLYNVIQDFPEFDTCGARESYSIVWPAEGMMTDDAKSELLSHYFYTETPSTDIKQAARNWREMVQNQYDGQLVDSVDENYPSSFSEMNSICRQDGKIATFIIDYYNYELGAAHGMYATEYVTVDVERGEIVHLSDLLDTANLGKVVARAIQDLNVNSEVQSNLFDEYRDVDEMPLSLNFFIDSTHSTINVVYDLYHIAPYCYGLQTVVLPVSWLSKQISLTPYANLLFVPDSYFKKK